MWSRIFSAITTKTLLAAGLLAILPASAFAGEDPTSFLKPDRDLAIWTAVVFLLLLGILYKFAWGPLTEGMNKREKSIADQIAQAAEANKKAQEILAQHDKKLAETAQEVRAILDKARQDADAAAREREAKAEADAKARLERAEKEIAAATGAAAKELADRSAKLAVELAGKIVRAKLNPKDHAQLIEQAVNGFTVNTERGKFASRN